MDELIGNNKLSIKIWNDLPLYPIPPLLDEHRISMGFLQAGVVLMYYKKNVMCKPAGPLNLYPHFIGANPPTSFNWESVFPDIDATAFIGPFSAVIGNVTIKENVFIAPNVTVRADEGSPFIIGANTNLQDGVILHGLNEGRVTVGGKKFSIYIGNRVSCAHGCLIHGPCKVGNEVFVGFNAIVFNAVIGDGSYISINAVVTGGVVVAPNRFVPIGAIIDTQNKADALNAVTIDQKEFTEEVQHINNEFPTAYSLMFGSIRCSCGLACDQSTLMN
jgi:carbon dioxide concentrating mechanism protein CcmM